MERYGVGGAERSFEMAFTAAPGQVQSPELE